MKLGVIAQQASEANLGLAVAQVAGIEVALLRPAQALIELHVGDVALGRLDVLPSVDGVEPGFWALAELERLGGTVLNGDTALANCHDKIACARALELAGLPHPNTGYLAVGVRCRSSSRRSSSSRGSAAGGRTAAAACPEATTRRTSRRFATGRGSCRPERSCRSSWSRAASTSAFSSRPGRC